MKAVVLIERTVTSIKSIYNSMTGIDNLFVANVIDSARETVLFERSMKGNKSIPSQLLQYVDIYFDASIQDSQDYTIYKLPRLSQVSAAITAPVNIMKTKGVAYPTYTNIQQYESMTRRKDMCDVDSILILNTSAGDIIRLYGERRNRLRAQGVFASPMELETFNPIHDEYPATSDMYGAMELQIANMYMKSLQAQAPKFVKETGVK